MSISEQVLNVLSDVSKQLGVAVEKLYPILIRQAQIDGVKRIFMGLVLLGMAFVLLRIFLKIIRNPKTDCFGDLEFNQVMTIFLCSFIGVLCFIFAIERIYSAITPIFNPDWYIIDSLLKNLVK